MCKTVLPAHPEVAAALGALGQLVPFSEAEPVRFAAAGSVDTETTSRTVTGRLVPYGAGGTTMAGSFTFAAGSITWPEDVKWVKLLVEHDQRHVVGYATRLWSQEDGLYGEFHLPEGSTASDQALAEAASGLRDAFSVGAQLDAATLERSRRNTRGGPVKASGVLREVSLVSVPAFDAARVESVAASHGAITVAAWSHPTERNTMLCQTCGLVHADGVTECNRDAVAAFAAGVQSVQAAAPAAPAPAPQGTAPAAPTVQASAPAPMLPAGGGAATITSQEPTYTFNGSGPSFVRDAFRAREDGDQDAASRLREFAASMADGGRQLELFMRSAGEDMATFAVETRTTAPEFVQEEVYRPDLLVAAVDRGRPMFSRLRSVTLTDATPFRVPSEGEFDGVADHVEGEAHAAEGTLTAGGGLVTPGAVSGAYRVTRELIDSSNPAIDGIATRAMLRDYRRKSEAKVSTAFQAVGAATLGVDTVAELRSAAIAFSLQEDMPFDWGFSGANAYTDYASELASDGRPVLPSINPTNAAGQTMPGYRALNLDGGQILPASALPVEETYLVKAEDVLVGESRVLTFRFDQPEGPGVVKLALWAYVFAHVLRSQGVKRLTTAAV